MMSKEIPNKMCCLFDLNVDMLAQLMGFGVPQRYKDGLCHRVFGEGGWLPEQSYLLRSNPKIATERNN